MTADAARVAAAVGRRARIPFLLVLEVLVAVLLAAAGVLGLIGFPLDRRLRLTRLCAMGCGYIAVEITGLLMAFGVWLVRPFRPKAWWDDTNRRLLAFVVGAILGWAGRTVGFRIERHPPTDSSLLVGPRPVLVLARHGGIGDSFTLAWVLASVYGRRPRIVLKALLRLEPMIDVLLTRLGACFLPRPSRRKERLEEEVGVMAAGLADGEALLLFPEGANWTPRRRLMAVRRLWVAGRFDAARAASAMEHVLPPRPAGVLACVDARPDIAVVTFAHAGLDRLTTAGQVWAALPFRVPMTLRWWPAAPVPATGDREAWLTTEWAVLDAWVAAQVDARLAAD